MSQTSQSGLDVCVRPYHVIVKLFNTHLNSHFHPCLHGYNQVYSQCCSQMLGWLPQLSALSDTFGRDVNHTFTFILLLFIFVYTFFFLLSLHFLPSVFCPFCSFIHLLSFFPLSLILLIVLPYCTCFLLGMLRNGTGCAVCWSSI